MAQKSNSSLVKKDQRNAIAAPMQRVQTLSTFLDSRREEIRKVLPPNVSVDRVIKTAILAAMEDYKIIEECTPMSIYRSVVQAAIMGLTVGNGLSEGYLIPYKGTCTFRASYLGWTKIARRSSEVDVIRASVVYSNDHFTLSEHPPSVEHEPGWGNEGRGSLVGAVAVAYKLENRNHVMVDFAYMSASELQQAQDIAERYKDSPAWQKWPDEMRKKAVTRRLCKWLPRNEDLNKLMNIENNADDGVYNVPDPDIDDINAMISVGSSEVKQIEEKKEEKPKEASTRSSMLKSQIKTKEQKPKIIETQPPKEPEPESRDHEKSEKKPKPEPESEKNEPEVIANDTGYNEANDENPDYGEPDEVEF